MLAGLWLNGLIRRDDKHNKINARDTREHVFNEPFVPGNVYKSDAEIVRQIEVRESEFNRYAPSFFLV